MVKEPDYGVCEACGHKAVEHCVEDVVDCIAGWPAGGSTPEQREKIHRSLRGADDYNAALALYWWMHLTSEWMLGESWPFEWEDKLLGWVEGGLPAGAKEPYPGWREEGQRLHTAAGGWWRDVGDARLFARTEAT